MSKGIISSVPQLTAAEKVKWLISVLVPLVVILIPTNAVLTLPLKSFIAVTALGILLFAFELVDTLIGSFILIFGY